MCTLSSRHSRWYTSKIREFARHREGPSTSRALTSCKACKPDTSAPRQHARRADGQRLPTKESARGRNTRRHVLFVCNVDPVRSNDVADRRLTRAHPVAFCSRAGQTRASTFSSTFTGQSPKIPCSTPSYTCFPLMEISR